MKRVLTALLLCAAGSAMAQNTGTVTYERKVNNHRRITDEQMRAMMPEFNTTKFVLYFSDSISVYKRLPEESVPDPFEGGGGGTRIMMRMGPADNGSMYKNFAKLAALQETELGDHTYIVEDSIRQSPWKLSDETKTILGIPCKKASMKTSVRVGGMMIRMGGAPSPADTANRMRMQEIETVAWYAESLPTPVGPENYGSLPGLILEVDVNNGETVIRATDIKKTVNPKDLQEPKKGKRISRADFQKKQQELFRNAQGGTIRFGG